MSTGKQTMLMVGDSLVEWGDWPELLPEYHTINRGLAGETVEGLAGRIFLDIDNHQDCDSLLIMSGTNNLLMGDMLFPAIFSAMLPRIKMLIPKTHIIVNGLLPMPTAPADNIIRVNEELDGICRRERCGFIDSQEIFAVHCRPITHPCFHPDGVHLTGRGYRTWAEAIRAFTGLASNPDGG